MSAIKYHNDTYIYTTIYLLSGSGIVTSGVEVTEVFGTIK